MTDDEDTDLTVAYLWGNVITHDDIRKLQEENERLRAALHEAVDEIEAWGSYASPYFREKHDLEGTLSELRAALGESKG